MTTNAMTADIRELPADDVDAVSGGGLHIHGTIGPFHFGLDITAGGIAGHYSINGGETHSGVIWFRRRAAVGEGRRPAGCRPSLVRRI